jgi:glycosyltransferase involved in cell wall biosynthesis
MKKVLLVGDHPYAFTGNGNMMRSLLGEIDYSRFEVTCFGVSIPSNAHYINSITPVNLPYKLIPYTAFNDELYGGTQILELIYNFKYDAMVIVGLDIWRYGYIFSRLNDYKKRHDIRFSGIFPYDLPMLRLDWVDWFNFFDIPCVYSEYGYNLLKDKVSKLQYFRPRLADCDLYKPLSPEEKLKAKFELQGGEENPDLFIFGFVGKNQVRKDPIRLLKAFGEIVSPQKPEAYLYMHTDINGVFNVQSLVQDYQIRTGTISAKKQGPALNEETMAKIYNGIDCLVNCSLQEGLSWTVLNAMLCGTPIIATDTTAQSELVKGVGKLVPCTELSYISTMTAFGQAYIEAFACSYKDLSQAMIEMLEMSKEERYEIGVKGIEKAQDWLDGCSSINALLENLTPTKISSSKNIKKKGVLFVQHSSAGDVLMSTQCFKEIKERHKDTPLIYMTQRIFSDIVEGNPYIDEIIGWDDTALKEYEVIYNPHGEKILPGGWNNLDITLHSLYPYFCKVEGDDIYIDLKEPDIEIVNNVLGGKLIRDRDICVVHTTGGQPQYRMYKHLDIALKGLDLFVIQVGGGNDWPVRCADLDLRGKLTWRETAWVMSQAGIAICVDSFPMHLAGALGINTVGIFGPAPARVTQPKMQHGAKSILLESNKLDVCPITSNCWGQPGKQVCATPCINTIHPAKVKKAIKSLMENKSC